MNQVGLYRSNRHAMIAGVMGGIAERFGWNVTLLRIIFIIISVMSAAFPGILVYLILWLVIPKQPQHLDMSSATHISSGNQRPIRTVYEENKR